jgi:LPS-assembly protein
VLAQTTVTLTAERVIHQGQRNVTVAEGRAQLVASKAAVSADQIVYDQGQNVATAVGHVVVRFVQGVPGSALADVVTLRFEGEQIEEIWVQNGVVTARATANGSKLLAATSREALDEAGPVTMLLEGNHLVRRDSGGWRLESLELTPCDCRFDRTSWSIRTSAADLNEDASRVGVWFPRVALKQVPLVDSIAVPLPTPYLNVPLSDRASGLLFPRPGSTILNGFSFEQPVFVTLGRSADLTLTPGYFAGGPRLADRFSLLDRFGNLQDSAVFGLGTRWRGESSLAQAPPAFVSPFGIWGPRLLAEFRYVLSERAQGRATVGLLYDLRERRDPGIPSLFVDGVRGLRGEASLFHTQDFGRGFGARVDASVHSDGFYQRDVTPDVIAREAGYLRSTAVVFHRGEDHLAALDAVLRQDLTAGYDLFGRDVFPRGSVAPRLGPNPMARLPALSISIPVRRVLDSPLAFDFSGDLVQQRPLRGVSGDEGALANEGRFFDPATGDEWPAECLVPRLFLARPADALPQPCPLASMASAWDGRGDGVFQRGERQARLRFNVMPRAWFAGQLGDIMAVSASVAWRQGAWADLASPRLLTRGYPLLAARAEVEAAKVYFEAFRHVIGSVVELRAVPTVVATSSLANDRSLLGGPAAYDDVDRSLSDNRPRLQAIAEVRNRIVQRGGRELVRFEVGQGFSLVSPLQPGPGPLERSPDVRVNPPSLAESYARLNANVGFFSFSGQLRLEPLWKPMPTSSPRPRVTRGSVTIACDFPGGHGFSGSYDSVLDDGTNRARAPIDLLFGDPAVASAQSQAQLVFATARTKLGPVGLSGALIMTNRLWDRLDDMRMPVLDASGRPVRDQRLSFAQYTVGVSWAPACDCWNVSGSMTQRMTADNQLGGPEFGFSVTVSRFGSIGSGG